MARQRTPLSVAIATGRTIKDRKRFLNRANPKVGKVGQPYEHMTREQSALWREYVAEFPWLAASDRMQLRMLCELIREQESNPDEFPFCKLNLIRQILNSFGGSPTNRSRVAAPIDDADDPSRKFLD